MPTVTKQAIATLGRRKPMKQNYARHITPMYRISGLGSDDSQCDLMCTLGKAIPIVGSVIGLVLKFLTNQTGQLKVDATHFAEAAVPLFYGTEPGCGMPTPNIPIVVGANPPLFCAASVAGMIERCQLTQATQLLALIQQKFQQAITTQPQVGPYIARWWNEYGIASSNSLAGIIASSQSACVSVPQTGGGGYVPPGGTYYPPISTGGTTNYTPYLILGGIGLVGLFLAMR